TTTNASNFGTSGTGTSVSFAATEVLAGSSVQGGGYDRISGIVTSRSDNTSTGTTTLAIQDGTLLSSDGSNTFIPGTSVITVGADTHVTEPSTGSALSNGLAQISVGSLINAFGTASASGPSDET